MTGLVTLRADHSDLVFGYDREASGPSVHLFVPKYFLKTKDETLTVRVAEANQQDAMVRPGKKLANVGEIQILRDQKPLFALRSFPDLIIGTSGRFSSAIVRTSCWKLFRIGARLAGRFSSNLIFIESAE